MVWGCRFALGLFLVLGPSRLEALERLPFGPADVTGKESISVQSAGVFSRQASLAAFLAPALGVPESLVPLGAPAAALMPASDTDDAVPPLETLEPPPAAASPSDALLAPPGSSDGTIGPGAYLSDSVIFRLNEDGSFDMRSLGGGRQARGHYTTTPGTLTLLDGTGDVGKTRFPLTCQVLRTAVGFAVLLGQPQCRQFDGISFRLAS